MEVTEEEAAVAGYEGLLGPQRQWWLWRCHQQLRQHCAATVQRVNKNAGYLRYFSPFRNQL